MKQLIVGLGTLVLLASGVTQAEPEASLWDSLLQDHSREGGLDYESLSRARPELDSYLSAIAVADLSGSSTDEIVAFHLNAYNAIVAGFVLESYPDFESVKDEAGFFDERTARVAGELMTLDEIEGVAREEGDPRVHFAVVCASTSCPDLRSEAYVASRLEDQLEEQTRLFLADPSKGLEFDAEDGVLYLSSIFKWYAGDFTGGSTVMAFFARGKVLDWVTGHLPAELAEEVKAANPSVRYMDYDWSLNDRP